MKTKETLKKALIFALCILPVAVVGGWLTGIYTFSYYTEEMRQLVLEQVGSYEAYLVGCAVQSSVYGLIAAFLGYILSVKTGLMKSFRFSWEIVKPVGITTVILGILFACDYFVFGNLIPEVAAEYEKGISPAYFFCSLTYGGVVEEILLRLFFMSLVAFLLWKVFARKYSKEEIPMWVFVAANVVSAIIFSAGHLPATINLFGHLSPLILLRCFLLNGAFALFFGRWYRKYGIQYAVMGHFGIHLISKLILLAVLG